MYARAPGRPKCEYGCSCYQANPAHWAQFDHPAEHERLAGTRGSREVGTRGSKRKQPEVPASDPAPDPAPRRARGDHRFERSEQSEAKAPKVVIDLDNEPDDGPEVAALIRMGFTPALAREAFASSCGADRLATAVQYCQDRQLAEGFAARLASSEQELRTLALALAHRPSPIPSPSPNSDPSPSPRPTPSRSTARTVTRRSRRRWPRR